MVLEVKVMMTLVDNNTFLRMKVMIIILLE